MNGHSGTNGTPTMAVSGWCDACGRTCQASSLAVMVWVDLRPDGTMQDRVSVPEPEGRLVCATCRDRVAHLLRTLGLRSR